MRATKLRLGLATVILLLTGSAQAADPTGPDVLPPPRSLPAEVLPGPTPLPTYPGFVRVNRYAVWDNYGVDRTGHFRPRVIAAPYGSYYLYNGAPYPWTGTRTMDQIPTKVD